MVDLTGLEPVTFSMSKYDGIKCRLTEETLPHPVISVLQQVESSHNTAYYGLTRHKTAVQCGLENPAMNDQIPTHLAAKLSDDLPLPKYRKWANAHGTPWEVFFPKVGPTPGKRRFFPTVEDAVSEILKWSKDRKPDAILGKRSVDDVLWAESILPPGITIKDAVRYYMEHNSSSSKMTLKEVTDAMELDRQKEKKSPAYQRNLAFSARLMNECLGAGSLAVHLNRAKLVKFVRDGDEFWDRFGRRRIASLVCTKMVELEIIKPQNNPMIGFPTEKEPKKSVHAMSNEDTQALLDYFSENYPAFVPAIALQLFAGIRTEELCREAKDGKRPLDWSDIEWGVQVRVPSEVSKTNEPREIEFWSEALTNWLMPFRKKSGPILERPEHISSDKFDFASMKSNIIEKLNTARAADELAPVDFQKNDFRHTFASNCVAFHKSFSVAQLCLGHTNYRTIKRYRTHKKHEDAVAYFSSKPASLHSNVIKLSA